MKKIYILEHFDFTNSQLDRLNKLGEVHYFNKATDKDILEAERNADVIMVDWIDPTNIITKMKKGSFVMLPFTGYGWISTIGEAIKNGVIISNTPNYSTNAVAEHHLALMIAAAKHVTLSDRGLKAGSVPQVRNVEITGKTIGIIGLGHIGMRLCELLKPFGVKLLTTSATKKNIDGIRDVSLDQLLKQSDFVCVTCKLNDSTRNMLGFKQLKSMKDTAVLTTTTNGVIDLDALQQVLDEGKLFGVGLEEFMDMTDVPTKLINNDKVVCTYHRAYDTNEAEMNRLNMSIDSIEAYINGQPINVIK